MALQFYNTLSRKKEVFAPLNPPKVQLYTCGPTVYNFAHIGNLRCFMFEDLLRRYLKYRGYDVRHVMNLTDVEDKIIRTCRETGESRESLTKRFAQAFFEDLDTLGIERAEEYPAATDHIPQMVEMVKTLLEKGHAYESKGSYYFRLTSFPEYGKLSHMDLDELMENASGRRVDSDEYETDDARDFALWKAWDEDDGDVFWETELGKGRPGWHIECSCMCMEHLAASIDIHCGGVDNMFPHHENEIAQSEAYSGKPFVKYWLHSAHLFVENKKMAKSAGNFYTLRDLVERGHDPLAIRWVLLATHYRQPNNFTFDALEAAKESLRRIQDFRARLEAVYGDGSDLAEEVAMCKKEFESALDDDLNISGALGVVFDFVRKTNKMIDENSAGEDGARNALALLDQLDAVTGLFKPAQDEEAPQAVLDLVTERSEARRAKDFARADAIRDQLLADGWVIEDTPDGARVKKA